MFKDKTCLYIQKVKRGNVEDHDRKNMQKHLRLLLEHSVEMKKENEQLKSIIANQKIAMYQHKEEMKMEILQLKLAMAEMKGVRPAQSMRTTDVISGKLQFGYKPQELQGSWAQSRSSFGLQCDTAKIDLLSSKKSINKNSAGSFKLF